MTTFRSRFWVVSASGRTARKIQTLSAAGGLSFDPRRADRSAPSRGHGGSNFAVVGAKRIIKSFSVVLPLVVNLVGGEFSEQARLWQSLTGRQLVTNQKVLPIDLDGDNTTNAWLEILDAHWSGQGMCISNGVSVTTLRKCLPAAPVKVSVPAAPASVIVPAVPVSVPKRRLGVVCYITESLVSDSSDFSLTLANRLFKYRVGEVGVFIPALDRGAFVLASENVSVALRAMTEASNVKLLSRPSIMLQEGQSATLSVGQQIPYTSTTLGGLSFVSNSTPQYIAGSVTWAEAATRLTVKVHSVSNSLVDLDLTLKLSSPGESVALVSGPVPALSERMINSRFSVRPGEAVVFGGLRREENRKARAGWRWLPWLDDRKQSNALAELTAVLIVEEEK